VGRQSGRGRTMHGRTMAPRLLRNNSAVPAGRRGFPRPFGGSARRGARGAGAKTPRRAGKWINKLLPPGAEICYGTRLNTGTRRGYGRRGRPARAPWPAIWSLITEYVQKSTFGRSPRRKPTLAPRRFAAACGPRARFAAPRGVSPHGPRFCGKTAPAEQQSGGGTTPESYLFQQ
jgi:hypothetical protein